MINVITGNVQEDRAFVVVPADEIDGVDKLAAPRHHVARLAPILIPGSIKCLRNPFAVDTYPQGIKPSRYLRGGRASALKPDSFLILAIRIGTGMSYLAETR